MPTGKYAPLWKFLMLQSAKEFNLSFAKIEEVLGSALPFSAKLPQWWSNEVNGSYEQVEAWEAASYEAFLQPDRSSVRFVKVSPT
jgi:hypothetical protein